MQNSACPIMLHGVPPWRRVWVPRSVATMHTALKQGVYTLSYRVAMRRQSLRLPNMRSI